MKMVAEYLEHAIHFENMAAQATDVTLKDSFFKQALAYRQLAAERARRQNLVLPSADSKTPSHYAGARRGVSPNSN